MIRTPKSGYLQYIRHRTLIRIATEADAVIRLPYRPGHFLIEGRELASGTLAFIEAQIGRAVQPTLPLW